MVLLVTMESQRFLVDVGVGGGHGPIDPILLVPDQTRVSLAPRSIRLIKRAISEQMVSVSSELQLVWQFEHRYSDAEDWTPTYAFSELEFFPADYNVMNWYTSTHRSSWFTYQIVCTKMLLDDLGENIVGELTLFERSVKRRIGGKTEVIADLNSEEERVEALERLLGVRLDEKERSGIMGTCTEIM